MLCTKKSRNAENNHMQTFGYLKIKKFSYIYITKKRIIVEQGKLIVWNYILKVIK